MLQTCNNIFWKDAFKTFYDKVWFSDCANYSTMPIWYNAMICNYFNNEWFTKGLVFVSDFFINKSFVNHDYLQDKIGIKFNFLDFANIKNELSKLNIFFNKSSKT